MQSGELVTPNVRLERQLGEGGMGSVWVAQHLGLDVGVAVKFMAPELVGSPDMRERFAREARAAARIDSPHVVRMLDHGVSADGTPYIVMELCEGETLRERLQRKGALDLDDAVRVVRGLCLALEAAHALGIVHRDIKPDNVFLHGRDRSVKVLDFGIAKHGAASQHALTAVNAVMGTPAYMSTEQLMAPASASPSFDLWSAAAVAFEAITGRLPFDGANMAELLTAVHDRRFEPPSRRGLPSTLDGFFQQAFHRQPNQRFESAAALADAFERACRAQRRVVVDDVPTMQSHSYATAQTSAGMPTPVSAPQLTPPQLTPPQLAPAPPASSRGWLYAVVGVVLLAIFAGGLAVARPWQKKDRDASESDSDDRRSRRRRNKSQPTAPPSFQPAKPVPEPPAGASCTGKWVEIEFTDPVIYEVLGDPSAGAPGEIQVKGSEGYEGRAPRLVSGELQFDIYVTSSTWTLSYACPCRSDASMICTFTNQVGKYSHTLLRMEDENVAAFAGDWQQDGGTLQVHTEMTAVPGAEPTPLVKTTSETLAATLRYAVLGWKGPLEGDTKCVMAIGGQMLRCLTRTRSDETYHLMTMSRSSG